MILCILIRYGLRRLTDYPNNDGIHINCSRNVTVSNSNIVCGDDCIIVRANSVSLVDGENEQNLKRNADEEIWRNFRPYRHAYVACGR